MTETTLLADARTIFGTALQECSIEEAFERKVQVADVNGQVLLSIGNRSYNLTDLRHLRIVAVGKASDQMLHSLLHRIYAAPHLDIQGVLIAPQLPAALPSGILFFEGGHPLPNKASFDGAIASLALVSETALLQQALCIFLISGGASAMMELPLASDITVQETALFYQALVHSGAKISEINCIRKHFSAVKGGRLALAAGSTPHVSILVSDVPPQHLDALGSGPTMPDSSTVGDCLQLLQKYNLNPSLPDAVRDFFHSYMLTETPKPNQVSSHVHVLLDSSDLGDAAARCATRLGYQAIRDDSCDDWSYEDAGRYLLHQIRLDRANQRLCLISTGEITVSVQLPTLPSHEQATQARPNPIGGRNQHFALYCATKFELSDQPLVVLSAGSDGVDGNSEAAGALVGTEISHTPDFRHAATRALEDFNSTPFLTSLDATIYTGPTGNNLRDLRLLLTDTPAE